MNKYTGLLASLFLLAGCSNVEEEPKEVEAVSSSYVKVIEPLNEQQQKAFDSLNDFNIFANNYANVEPIERSPLWDDYIYGTKVTWTGTIVEVGGKKITLIDTNYYYDGASYLDLADKPEIYRVFMASFNYELPKSTLTPGQQLTVTGDLESRGNPINPATHWKMYNSEIVQ